MPDAAHMPTGVKAPPGAAPHRSALAAHPADMHDYHALESDMHVGVQRPGQGSGPLHVFMPPETPAGDFRNEPYT